MLKSITLMLHSITLMRHYSLITGCYTGNRTKDRMTRCLPTELARFSMKYVIFFFSIYTPVGPA